tara:strand:- start:2254 stop:2694 length:441 start_codon:yes stop_codon:yes gene_type:complete
MSILNDNRIIELKEFTSKIHHLDKMLFDHLYATYNILKEEMKKPEYLCMAGLFHSIYETEYFQFNTSYTRDKVKSLIGETSEKIVYEFCSLKPRINGLVSRAGNWDNQLYADLLDLEIANMKEQQYYNDEIKLIIAIRKHLKTHET